MSVGYLLKATRDHLRTQLASIVPGGAANAKYYIGVQPDGRPPARMHDWYIAIEEGGVESGEKAYLKEHFTVDVFITKATGKFAPDNLGEMYLEATQGLDPLERAVIVAIHGSHALRTAANALAGAPGAGGDIYQQPLWYRGRGKTNLVAGDWAGLEPDAMTFAVRKLPFFAALRVQALEIMQ